MQVSERQDCLFWSAVVFAVALAARTFHLVQIRTAPFVLFKLGDAETYDAWARQIAAGDWLGKGVFYQAPLYPYWLGSIYALLGDDAMTVRKCQALLGACSCVLLAGAAWRFFSKPAGILAGLLLALYAPAIFFDGLIQKTSLSLFLVCLMLWLLSRLVVDPNVAKSRASGGRRAADYKTQLVWRSSRWRSPNAAWSGNLRAAVSLDEIRGLTAPARHFFCNHKVDKTNRWGWLGLGMALGALTLTRENAIVLAVPILAWLALHREADSRGRGERLRQRLGLAGLFLAGTAGVLLPVALRNQLVGGELHLTTSQWGPNFYIGNNPEANGTYRPLRFGRGHARHERGDATVLAEQAVGRKLTPGEVSTYYVRQACHYIASQPLDWLGLMARKLALTWNAVELTDSEDFYTHAQWSLPLRATGWVFHFGALAPLALLGVWATWDDRGRLSLLYWMVIAFAASVVLFFVFARYRFPLVPLLVLFAAAGLTRAAAFRRAASSKRVIACLVTTAAVAVFCNWPLVAIAPMRATTHNNLGNALARHGRFDEAIAQYQRALQIQPDCALAHNNLGVVLMRQGQVGDAIAHFQRALRIRPDYPSAAKNLARGRRLQGEKRSPRPGRPGKNRDLGQAGTARREPLLHLYARILY